MDGPHGRYFVEAQVPGIGIFIQKLSHPIDCECVLEKGEAFTQIEKRV